MLRLADSRFEREALVSCKVRFRRGIGQLDAVEMKSAVPKSADPKSANNTKFADFLCSDWCSSIVLRLW
jgi:hypothetical protein